MSVRIKGLFFIVFLIGGIACADSTLSAQAHNNQSEKKTTNDAKQECCETTKMIISSSTEPSAIYIKDDNSKNNKTWSGGFCGWFTAFLHKLINDPNSFLIMVFTGVLACVSIYQGRQQATALQLARDEFIATHRPHIRVRRIDSIGITAEQPITVKLEAANIGITEARIVQISIDIFFAINVILLLQNLMLFLKILISIFHQGNALL